MNHANKIIPAIMLNSSFNFSIVWLIKSKFLYMYTDLERSYVFVIVNITTPNVFILFKMLFSFFFL